VTADDVAKIAGALAWPFTGLIAVLLVYKPLRILLKRLSETLTLKSLKVKHLVSSLS